MIYFDHIEVHVKNALEYSKFLVILFKNGRYKKIADDNTYMFISHDLIRIEIKESNNFNLNSKMKNHKGFCMPCLRTENAKEHLDLIEGVSILKTLDNPDGKVYFFSDYEGIVWHIKDYQLLDKYVNF